MFKNLLWTSLQSSELGLARSLTVRSWESTSFYSGFCITFPKQTSNYVQKFPSSVTNFQLQKEVHELLNFTLKFWTWFGSKFYSLLDTTKTHLFSKNIDFSKTAKLRAKPGSELRFESQKFITEVVLKFEVGCRIWEFPNIVWSLFGKGYIKPTVILNGNFIVVSCLLLRLSVSRHQQSKIVSPHLWHFWKSEATVEFV